MDYSRHKRSRLRRELLWGWLALVCALTFEMAARVDDWLAYGAPVLGTYDMEELFHPTPRGWRGVAHASFVKWRLNGSGFRGPEVKPDAGQIRIGVRPWSARVHLRAVSAGLSTGYAVCRDQSWNEPS